MPFCFQSFSCFENQWVRDMSISSVENGCSNLAGITNQQSGSRVQPVSHSQNSISPLLWQAGRLGSKLLLSSGVMRKTFLSASVRAPLRELSAQPGNCNPSVTASQMWDFVSLKMGFSSLCWTHRLLVLEKDLAPIDSSILHCPHNRSNCKSTAPCTSWDSQLHLLFLPGLQCLSWLVCFFSLEPLSLPVLPVGRQVSLIGSHSTFQKSSIFHMLMKRL